MGCTKLEAAETLMAVPDMCHKSRGSVRTLTWNRFLLDLGLVRVSTERSDEERKAIVQERREAGGWGEREHTRYVERQGRGYWTEEVRQTAPHEWQRTVRFPTVSQWLAANPNVTAVVNVRGHTLLVQDGEVTADTLHTKSMRRRVEEVFVLEN